MRGVYSAREARFTAAAEALGARGRVLMTARLIAFGGAIAAGVLWEVRESRYWLGAAILLVAVFIALVVEHRRAARAEAWQRALARANRMGLQRLARSWPELPAVRPPTPDMRAHPYADDLDVFGNPALTQLLAPVASPTGRKVMQQWFLSPDPPPAVRMRQEAVRALASELDWRDELFAIGSSVSAVPASDIDNFLVWTESPGWPSGRKALIWSARLIPMVTIGLAAAQAAGATDRPLWLLPVITGALISLRFAQHAHDEFNRAFAREGVLHAMPALLAHAAAVPGDAKLLDTLRASLQTEGRSAADQLARLTHLMRLSELRFSSMLHFPVQVLTLWDFHVLHMLERWKARAGRHAREWLHAAGEIEACAALAATAHDHPDWAFPVIDEQAGSLNATALGHPMLPDDRCVRNDVEVGPQGTLLLVTGSNMSGKSTLLRALGCNVVLGQAGAPVCAESMTIPPLAPFTSGRIRDSLTEGVSLFLAELQRMRAVVDAARGMTDRTLFYLLDEMLHGTNTAERRIAARTVIEHLLEQRAIGVVTTHDLSLAEETPIAQKAARAHFTEHVTRDEAGLHMDFDYLLRPGLATSSNALTLLEIVGLARGTGDSGPARGIPGPP